MDQWTNEWTDGPNEWTDPALEDKKPLMDDAEEDVDAFGEDIRAGYVSGFPLLMRQIRGLLWKRYINWRRDSWSIIIQIVVPVLFFVLALFMATLDYSEPTDFLNIDIGRNLLGNRPTIVSSRSSDEEATAVLGTWDAGTVTSRPYEPMLSCECNCAAKGQFVLFGDFECCMYDSAAATAAAAAAGMEDAFGYCATRTGAASGNCATTSDGMNTQRGTCETDSVVSFDGYLWKSSEANTVCVDQDTIGCDALHVEGYDAAAGRYTHTIYAHQSAYHSLPATANSANSAILRRRLNKPVGPVCALVHSFALRSRFIRDCLIIEYPVHNRRSFA